MNFDNIKSKTILVYFSMARQINDGKGRIGGRQKGTPNKVTANVKEWLSTLIDKNRKQIEKDIKALKPRERLAIIEKFMQYVVPKQQAVSTNVNFERLTDSQLDTLIDELTKEVEDENTD